ncbi:MAG TPA: AIPR family protein [Flavobacterium sp.]|nr:AIPR family protein [Flavobacterium sp.]
MTNEPIINARFKKFRDNYGLNNMADGDAFERFTNSAILTSHQPDAFSADSELLDKVCIGGMGDNGIDGLAIKLNGILVKTIDEINDIIARFKTANIEFIFVQSKYKDKFEAAELNSFIAGVRNFLNNEPAIALNEKSAEMFKLKKYLMSDEIVYHWENNPSVRMYYVAMGKWRSIPQHLALAEQAKSDIKSSNIYDQVDLHFIDSESLKIILDSNENNFTAFIDTIVTMELTQVDRVENSFIALCTGDEFSKMLTTEEGVIRKSLFDDNVRDYQGENSVNSEILNTIKEEPSKFILLNNGITVVCDEFTTKNRRLKITNPQIVNGCQTSHVLFAASKKGLDISKIQVNVKFISTTDTEISNDIVRGTNRQNIVLDEAFEATKKFHKDLEEFVNHINVDYPDKIYYERRSKQYSHNPTIKQIQKINLRILTQYFSAMFLNKPHLSHRHESVLLREQANILFQETQSKLPYFVSSYAFYQLEKLFREAQFYPELKPYKAHLLMIFRESIAGKVPSINNEKPIDEHSQKLISVLKDQQLTAKRFEEVAKVFKETMTKWINSGKSRFAIKDIPDFTSFLLSESQKHFIVKAQTLSNDEDFVYKGVVVKTIFDRFGNYCGFIKRSPDNIFFHTQQNKDLNFVGLEGKFVSYKVTVNPKDNRQLAVNVEQINMN